eukprot:g439.t1
MCVGRSITPSNVRAITWLFNMAAKIFLGLLLFVVLVGAEEDKHVFGPNNIAFCPVTTTKLHISHSTSFVDFRYGQKVYVLNEASAELYRNEPRRYFLGPYDEPLEGKDGYRGLPDMHNQTVRCPITNTSFVVKQMSSPRIMMKNGQFVYFCCMDCMMKFFIDPGKYIIGAGPKASEFLNAVDEAKQKMQSHMGDDMSSKDKESNQITVTILATIFVLLSIELLLFVACVLVYKSKSAGIVRFFKLSTDNDQDNEDYDITLAKVGGGSQQERYTDDV